MNRPVGLCYDKVPKGFSVNVFTSAHRLYRAAGSTLPLLRQDPADWLFAEYWTGVIFNGNKIGFSHLKIYRDEKIDALIIDSEAALAFHFLGVGKEANLVARDHVGRDLALRQFDYDYAPAWGRTSITY